MIPKLYKNAKLSDFCDEIQKKVKDWIRDDYSVLYVHGASGTGKTHLLAAMINELVDQKKRSAYVLASDVALELRNSISHNFDSMTELAVVKKYRKNIYGAFDDFAATKATDYYCESWYSIINHRYENQIPTMYASNFSLNNISTLVGDRIASRLASGIVIEMVGKDRRLTV